MNLQESSTYLKDSISMSTYEVVPLNRVLDSFILYPDT